MEKGSIMIVATCIVSFAYLASGIPGIASILTRKDMADMSRICDDIPTNGVMVAAAGRQFGFDKSKCGRLYSVRCTGASSGTNPCRDKNVTVMVVFDDTVDLLALDLPKEAFNIIANSEMTYIIKIDYELI